MMNSARVFATLVVGTLLSMSLAIATPVGRVGVSNLDDNGVDTVIPVDENNPLEDAFGPDVSPGGGIPSDGPGDEDDSSDVPVDDDDPFIPDEHRSFSNEFVEVPTPEDTESEFSYGHPDASSSISSGSPMPPAPSVSTSIMGGMGPPSDDEDKGKLGRAPDALYRVLQKFLAKGKAPPPHFPVPYVIYTNSSGVETFTDVLTKMSIQIDVDDDKDTGRGNGKDVSVQTTMDVSPLTLTTTVELLGDVNPPDLEIYVTFPAFFYNGEAGDPEGEPYWTFGYRTQPGYAIPGDVTMTFSVDASLGSEHVFDFDWTSGSGIGSLGFIFGTFQVLDEDTSSPILPAFANFVVSSPPFASLTFETQETDTMSRKCMVWSAPSSFFLSFDFAEIEAILGLDYEFPMTITVDEVPQSFSICTTEDRAANTYTVDYVASSTVDLLMIETEIVVGGVATVTIELSIEDMPAEFHLVLGNGYMNVDVTSNVGLVVLNATADIGLAGIDSMINVVLRIADIPDFSATWFQDGTGNGFALNAVSCIGSIEIAFSFGDLVYPSEHEDDPDSHYLFAWSDPAKTAIAIRLLDLGSIEFTQNNDDASNSLTVTTCTNHVLYVLAHTEVGSLLTPDTDLDLRIVVDQTPTELTLTWTVPFTLAIATNDHIDSITGDLTLETAGPPARELNAHAEILDIPGDILLVIDPSGSISFLAEDDIGAILLTATDPNGLPGAETFFAGEPIRLLNIAIYDVPPFSADWFSDSTPWTSISFNSAPSTSVGSLSFAISTSEGGYATVGGAEENRGMIYNDDNVNLGHGLVMEASIWIHVEDVDRAELAFGGTTPTYEIGFGTAVAHELRAAGRFDRTSSLNPAGSGDDIDALVVTTALPTSVDFTLTPTESFGYDASGMAIDHVDVDVRIGDLSPGAPVPADVDWIQLDIYGIPESADGQWDLSGSAGFFHLQLADGATLERIELVLENAFGVFGTDYQRVEASIDSLPENVAMDWSLGSTVVTISFTDAAFDGGLGEAYLLATTMNEADTTSYINSLDIDTSVCMTSYSSYEEEIDDRYWPGTTLEDNLRATYCRNPELNTATDDYAVSRTGGGETLFTARIRELHEVSIDLGNDDGFAEVEFTPDVTLDREMYLRTEDVDPGDDDLTLAELSELPDGAGDNRFYIEYDRTVNVYQFEASESIEFIDAYIGTRSPTSKTLTWYKLLLADLPTQASLSFDLSSSHEGFLLFEISSTFELGFVVQDSDTRYASWVELTGISFDYEFYGPGELPTSHDVGYYIARIDIDIHTVPAGTEVNGILGIYNLKSNPEDLINPAFSAPSDAYIPEWTFILHDFTNFEFFVDWDVGIDFDLFDSSSGVLTIELFPTISVEVGFRPVIDYWWNSRYTITVPHIPLPPPPPFLYAWMDGTIVLNEYLDYTENSPIHLLPWTTLAAVDISLDADWNVYLLVLNVEVHMTINVPGFHDFSDHS